MTTIETLRFWCQKVLPLVYDDSLSYYELLAKCVLKLNEIADVSNTHGNAIDILNAEYSDLDNKVEGLIDNLVDVIVPWDSSIAYRIFSIVEYQGTNYIAVQDVPIGTMITNTDYWQPANTVVEQINAIATLVDDFIDNNKSYVTPEEFGAVGDGITDDTLALQRAIDYATQNGTVCKLLSKTYLVTQTLFIHTHTILCGTSRYTSFIKLADSSDCDVMQTDNFIDLTTNADNATSVQPYEIILSDFSVDGNRDNQNSGNGICICASRVYINNIDIRNIKYHGLWDSFIYNKIIFVAGITTSQANWITNVRVFNTGKHGIFQPYGNDFFYSNVIVADASMNEDKTYDMLNLSGGARLNNVHPWSSHPNLIPTVCRYAINFVSSDYECSLCHFEGGGDASINVEANAHVKMTCCNIYASRGEQIAIIKSALNRFDSCTFQSHAENLKAITYGGVAQRNAFSAIIRTNTPDQIYFADDSESGGMNNYEISYYGNMTSTSTPPVRNLNKNSTLVLMPSSAGPYQALNYMGDLQIRRLFKDMFIFDSPTESPTVNEQDTIIVKSNNNAKAITIPFKYFNTGTEISIYNMMSGNFTVYGGYVNVDGTTKTNTVIASKTVCKILIVEKGSENTNPKAIVTTQAIS